MVRKADILKTIRETLKLTVGYVAREIPMDRKTIQRAEDPQKGSQEGTIRALKDYYQHYYDKCSGSEERNWESIPMLLRQLDGLVDEKADSQDEDPGARFHSDLLQIYEGCSYVCYYISPDTDPDLKLEQLTIGRLESKETGCLRASASARGNNYLCEVTCAKAASYSFFTFTLDSPSLSDRVLLMVPYKKRIKVLNNQRFCAGVGALLSLAYPSGPDQIQYPCFQKAAIISTELKDRLNDDEVLEMVTWSVLSLYDENSQDIYRSCTFELQHDSDAYYHELMRRINLIDE